MMELFEHTVVIGASDSFGEAHRHFDVGLKRTFQHLVDFAVIVIIVADAEHALNVIPNGRAESRSIHIPLGAHKIVRQLVHESELVIQQISDVIVQAIDE